MPQFLTASSQTPEELATHFSSFWDSFLEWGKSYLPRLVAAIVILLVGWYLVKWICRSVKKAMSRGKTDAGVTSFVNSALKICLWIVLLLVVAAQLGLQINSIIAALGAAAVAIALAVMHDPELLILDEPINGLDPIGIAEVRDFIRALCEERGKTILISSHILSEIALLADDIGIIDHGVLLEEESLVELEQKNGKVLRFTVSNATVAAQLLQKEMGVRDVAVENGRELTVRDLRLDTGAAVRRFVEAGLVVSDAHLYEDTLEDYFKRITGGEGIA